MTQSSCHEQQYGTYLRIVLSSVKKRCCFAQSAVHPKISIQINNRAQRTIYFCFCISKHPSFSIKLMLTIKILENCGIRRFYVFLTKKRYERRNDGNFVKVENLEKEDILYFYIRICLVQPC